MGWAPVIALLSFFAFRVLLESGKANRLRAAWTKKGTTVPNNRLSRLQDQFKIRTRPAAGVARCKRSPLQAPAAGGVGGEPHNRHLRGRVSRRLPRLC